MKEKGLRTTDKNMYILLNNIILLRNQGRSFFDKKKSQFVLEDVTFSSHAQSEAQTRGMTETSGNGLIHILPKDVLEFLQSMRIV